MHSCENREGNQAILIVEDSLTQAEALRHTLESHGWQCVIARNGREALETVRRELPALVISDVLMPEMDGYEFCRALKSDERLKSIPVILLTALTDSSDIIRGLECGADNFVTKPYENDYLLARISYLLVNRGLSQTAEPHEDIELEFGGRRHKISAGRRQTLDLLLSTYDQCVQINTRLKERERELEAANRRLAELYEAEQCAREAAEEASRAKDSFLAMVTHELRSPLNAMLGWTRVLRTRELDEETRLHALETIEQSARTQSRLIEDLLDTARIASGKMRLDLRPVDLVDVINAALAVIRPAAEAKGVELLSEFDDHVNVITGDPDRLQQVVWNLLSNAVKFTSEGGRISVRLERADPHARITVSDTGRGISPDFLPHVFERFAQQSDQAGSTRRRSGLGLGLSLARHLVELHGGTIEAASEGEGRGATFTVRLPLRAVRARERADGSEERGQAQESAALLEEVRALVVDDEPDARELIAAVLRQYGAQVTAVASVGEALQTLQSGASFDVLVSDIGMPEVSGYELIRQVRALPPEHGGQIPAVALTAFGRSTDRIRALSAGFQMHIPKPVEPAELAIVVATLTGRARQGMNA
ncbi:MAG TPA: response regulator [Blastocatellia bacterium]|nr:response regulator [Blastocatellia bacterium]